MIARVFWVDPSILVCSYWNVSMQLLGGSVWLLSCCYLLLRMFWMVPRVLLWCSKVGSHGLMVRESDS